MRILFKDICIHYRILFILTPPKNTYYINILGIFTFSVKYMNMKALLSK